MAQSHEGRPLETQDDKSDFQLTKQITMYII